MKSNQMLGNLLFRKIKTFKSLWPLNDNIYKYRNFYTIKPSYFKIINEYNIISVIDNYYELKKRRVEFNELFYFK